MCACVCHAMSDCVVVVPVLFSFVHCFILINDFFVIPLISDVQSGMVLLHLQAHRYH
jgi:hypothetical protein